MWPVFFCVGGLVFGKKVAPLQSQKGEEVRFFCEGV